VLSATANGLIVPNNKSLNKLQNTHGIIGNLKALNSKEPQIPQNAMIISQQHLDFEDLPLA